ncbi:MerR family transcriptional regulator [Caniella muris]|uniref:MerR family transcriptional regulator n=1 Tax=Caniella muris TaxID=2941502 RepID=UPI00204014BC|nr:MerR family transcriptional regulator [Caniella muris]
MQDAAGRGEDLAHGGLHAIGDASRLGGVSQRTLRHYDKLGLIKPDRIARSGYRYYSEETLLKVPVISYLKSMGFSLEEVATVLSSRDFQVIEDLFHRQLDVVGEHQAELEAQRRIIADWTELIDEATCVLSMRPQEVGVAYLPARSLLSMEYEFSGNYAEALINLDFTAFVRDRGNVVTGPVMLWHESFERCREPRRFPEAVRVLQASLRPPGRADAFMVPGGVYLRAYHTGPFEALPATYERMVAHGDAHGYRLEGPSIERFVTDFWTTANPESFVCEVLMPLVVDGSDVEGVERRTL